VDLSSAAWQKSARSGSNGCVEVAFVGGQVAVRDSKDRSGSVLLFTSVEWKAFIGAVRDGQFELPNSTAQALTGQGNIGASVTGTSHVGAAIEQAVKPGLPLAHPGSNSAPRIVQMKAGHGPPVR
jgi:hypothetical protein